MEFYFKKMFILRIIKMTYQPLKPNWKLKDGYADQFHERTNSEANFIWAKNPDDRQIMEQARYNESLGKNYLRSKKVVYQLW